MAEPIYPTNTKIKTLAKLTTAKPAGKVPGLAEHIDLNMKLIMNYLEGLSQTLFAIGGRSEGTVTLNGSVVRVRDVCGATRDSRALIYVADETLDLETLSPVNGSHIIGVSPIGKPDSVTFTYTDRDGVSETLTHQINVDPARIVLVQGTPGSYPTPNNSTIEVARVQKSGATWTLDELVEEAPIPQPWFNNGMMPAGVTAGRPNPSLNPFGRTLSYFDSTLGKPIWWSGSGWVDATGTVV